MKNKVTYINIAVSVILVAIEIYIGLKYIDLFGIVPLMALLFYLAIITVLIVHTISALICSYMEENSKPKNKNGRVYDADAVKEAMSNFSETVASVSFAGEIQHPESNPSIITSTVVMKVQSVSVDHRDNKFIRFFENLFKRNKPNKDVERVMNALNSDNLIIAHEGPLRADKISVNLHITSIKKHQSDIDLEDVDEEE